MFDQICHSLFLNVIKFQSDVHAITSSNIPSPANNQIRDSNFNYVENEFSDDEDATAKSTDSKNSIRNSISGFLKSYFK